MERFAAFEKEAARMLEAYHVPSCIVSIAKDGEIVYEKGFGHHDQENERKTDGGTVFGLASLTKSFTCAAIMKLVEQGKLRLDDPIVRYLPEFHVNDERMNEMTIFHFMTHTSGLPPLPSLDLAMTREKNKTCLPDQGDMPSEEELIETYGELMAFIKDEAVRLIDNPGSLFSYSNDAYGLLGAIIERVSGVPYEDFVIDEIIKPCGMEHTYFLKESYENYENIAVSYEISDQTSEIYVAEDWWDAPPMRATGFLRSTATDMLQYAKLYLNQGVVNGERILSETSIAHMLHPNVKMNPEKMYGFGFSMTEDYHGMKLVDHGGSLKSVSAKFVMLPEEGMAVIILANLSDFPVENVLEMVLNTYFGRELTECRVHYEPYELSLATLHQYTGSYASGEGMNCTLAISKDEPAFTYKGELCPLAFVSDTVFITTIDGEHEPAEILMDEAGEVFALSLCHRVLFKQ